MLSEWQEKHLVAVRQVAEGLAKDNMWLVFKGATALALFEGLDRFHPDITFDCREGYAFLPRLESICEELSYSCHVDLLSDDVKCMLVNYGDDEHQIKVEAFWNRSWSAGKIRKVEGMQTYTDVILFEQILRAYNEYPKIARLWDLMFLYERFAKDAPNSQSVRLKDVLASKGLEHTKWVIASQSSDLPKSALLLKVLEVYQQLGLDGTRAELEFKLNKYGLTRFSFSEYVEKVISHIPPSVYNADHSREENALHYLPKVFQFLT
jgi:hypothetical protein